MDLRVQKLLKKNGGSKERSVKIQISEPGLGNFLQRGGKSKGDGVLKTHKGERTKIVRQAAIMEI